MGYLLAASVGLFLLYFLARAIGRTDVRALASAGRWIGGGIAVFLGVILSIGGRAGIGSMLAFGGVALLRQAWQQRNNTKPIGSDTVSTVRSRFIRMQMDHDTGEVWGEIISGHMAGTDLDALDEAGTRRFVEEITGDADSVSLLETYLDANRAGWRDYFEGQTHAGGGGGSSGASASGPLDTAQALEILGLEAGATPEQIREAHRSLMKRVHPDAGGSTFLAAKINEAKDFLLAQRK